MELWDYLVCECFPGIGCPFCGFLISLPVMYIELGRSEVGVGLFPRVISCMFNVVSRRVSKCVDCESRRWMVDSG